MKSKIRRFFNPFSIAALILLTVSAVLRAVMSVNADFADTYNRTVGFAVRFVLAKIFNPLPISFAELLLFSSPVILFLLCRAVAKASKKSIYHAFRALISTALAAGLIWCIFTLDFAAGYRGTSLAEKLDLKDREVSAEELYKTAEIMSSELNILCEKIDYLNDGSSMMPFSHDEMSAELCEAYKEVCAKYTFIDSYNTRIKPLVISTYMTYTHISGIYTFFTGEANLNTNFPDYINVFTAAHEMAHQRGISREDEANFTAFLVCSASDNEYVRYSAYLNMYEYLSSALWNASPELYTQSYYGLSPKVRGELAAYSKFFDKYRDNAASDISDKMNDVYLESQGTAGTASYGMVVDLAVAYYLD